MSLSSVDRSEQLDIRVGEFWILGLESFSSISAK